MNTARHTVCPVGTPVGTPCVRHAVSHGGACWVQNQNQIQNQMSMDVVCGVSGYDSIHRCRSPRPTVHAGWMLR